MKPYTLISTKTEYKLLVLSVSYISPFDEIEELENDLREMNFKGIVLFDLILCNGVSPNRFIKSYFDGNSFYSNTFEIVNNIKDDVKLISSNFYKNNSDLIDKGVLSKPYSLLLKKRYSYLNRKINK